MRGRKVRTLKRAYNRSVSQALRDVQKLPLALRRRWALAVLFRKEKI
jgi:hypothetical protein